jgi:hypothetical protein
MVFTCDDAHRLNPHKEKLFSLFVFFLANYKVGVTLVDSSLFHGDFHFADGGEKGPRGGAGRRLHPSAEAVVGLAVHPCHPCVLEQRVAAPVVLPPE